MRVGDGGEVVCLRRSSDRFGASDFRLRNSVELCACEQASDQVIICIRYRYMPVSKSGLLLSCVRELGGLGQWSL